MHCRNVKRWLAATWLVLFALAAISGCHNGEKCRSCNDITPGAIPQPNGEYSCQWTRAEMARAAQDSFVIYQYEWSYEGTKLTATGQEHVACMAKQLQEASFPIVIEPSPDDRVNLLRRTAVLESLANCGAQVGANRVVVGQPDAEGLYGLEAPGVANRMLTVRGGTQGGGSGGLGSGTTSGGGQGNIGSSSGIGSGVGMGMGSGIGSY